MTVYLLTDADTDKLLNLARQAVEDDKRFLIAFDADRVSVKVGLRGEWFNLASEVMDPPNGADLSVREPEAFDVYRHWKSVAGREYIAVYIPNAYGGTELRTFSAPTVSAAATNSSSRNVDELTRRANELVEGDHVKAKFHDDVRGMIELTGPVYRDGEYLMVGGWFIGRSTGFADDEAAVAISDLLIYLRRVGQ